MPKQSFLDSLGVEYLWKMLSMEDYPNNEELIAVINAIDATKQDIPNMTEITLFKDKWDASGKYQIVEIDGILADTNSQAIYVYPFYQQEIIDAINNNKVYASAQEDGAINFKCETIPTIDIKLYIKWENIIYNSNNNNNKPPIVKYKTMTVIIDQNNTDPAAACTYADDAIGMTPGSAEWDEWFGYYPCILDNGVEVERVNPNNYKQFEDGVTFTLTSSQDVMIARPKMGWKINTVDNITTISMTDNPNAESDGFVYYAHFNGVNYVDKFYEGAYKGWSDGTKLRSMTSMIPTVNTSLTDFRSLARAHGSGYNLRGYYQLLFWQIQYLLKYKNRNSQVAVGADITETNNLVNTGLSDTKGMNYGDTTGVNSAKCLGIENPWGNIYEWIDGIHSNNAYDILICKNPNNFSSTIGDSNYDIYLTENTSNIYGKIQNIQGNTNTGFIIKTKSIDYNLDFCDYGNLYSSRFAYFGGIWDDGSAAGAFSLRVADLASDAYSDLGSRLMYV